MEIKQKLEKLAEELANIIPSDHPKWNDVFEDVGAAGYYIEESVYRVEGAIKTLADDE
ncbi:hypothetical protein KBT16_22825 [Nostoc sp. CCCryo 231-06]|nr:hypothetical protein [Nostoc sp. CCCryo 231-06]